MQMIFDSHIQVGRTDGHFPTVEIYIFRLNKNLSWYSKFYPDREISSIVRFLGDISNTVGCRYCDFYSLGSLRSMDSEIEKFDIIQRWLNLANSKKLQEIKKVMNRYFKKFNKDLEDEV